jgi:hypothetical protein
MGKRLRIIVFDLIVVPMLLGWLFLKYPEMFDAVIPWAAFGWLWHLTWELVLESEGVKSVAYRAISRWGRMAWVFVFLIGGMISLFYLFTVRSSLALLANAHAAHEREHVGPPPTPEASPNPAPSPTDSSTVQPTPEARPPQGSPIVELNAVPARDKSHSGGSKVVSPPAPIPKEETPKYKAIALSARIQQWLGDVQKPFGNTSDEVTFHRYVDELYRQYHQMLEIPVKTIAKELKECGANTDKLEQEIKGIDDPSPSIVFFEGIMFQLHDAAYDIPGGQPECGTKVVEGTGFHEKDNGIYLVKVGNTAMGLAEDQLTKGPVSLGTWGEDIKPLSAYLLNGNFYLDVHLFGGFHMPAVEIVRNEFTVNIPSWDHNVRDHTFEVVNENTVPMLQVIFETDRRVRVNGVFAGEKPNEVLILAPGEGGKIDIDPTGHTPITVPLKPLFKYPSWKYPGIYADN